MFVGLFEHIIIANEKIRGLLIHAAFIRVYPIHPEQDGLLNIKGRT